MRGPCLLGSAPSTGRAGGRTTELLPGAFVSPRIALRRGPSRGSTQKDAEKRAGSPVEAVPVSSAKAPLEKRKRQEANGNDNDRGARSLFGLCISQSAHFCHRGETSRFPNRARNGCLCVCDGGRPNRALPKLSRSCGQSTGPVPHHPNEQEPKNPEEVSPRVHCHVSRRPSGSFGNGIDDSRQTEDRRSGFFAATRCPRSVCLAFELRAFVPSQCGPRDGDLFFSSNVEN